jgi:hypothetical protein
VFETLAFLPDWLEIAISVLVVAASTGATAYLRKKPQTGLAGVLRDMRERGILSYNAVDRALEHVLRSVGIPISFAEWAKKALNSLLERVPMSADLPAQQRKDILAAEFSSLTKAQASNVLDCKELNGLLSHKFARKRVARRLLKKMSVNKLASAIKE